MWFRRKTRHHEDEDAFISFHFWMTNREIADLEEIARRMKKEPAAVVQQTVKQMISEWRKQEEKASASRMSAPGKP
ncbi:hypothetical protein [Staphylospora marina]|uniref:hypothetical protein n=1 Tax=Staphylospora marina TaxID=2490858 RepID=UPI000F5BB4C9|nr:hypothetical protein [Staphylospora marina]